MYIGSDWPDAAVISTIHLAQWLLVAKESACPLVWIWPVPPILFVVKLVPSVFNTNISAPPSVSLVNPNPVPASSAEEQEAVAVVTAIPSPFPESLVCPPKADP